MEVVVTPPLISRSTSAATPITTHTHLPPLQVCWHSFLAQLTILRVSFRPQCSNTPMGEDWRRKNRVHLRPKVFTINTTQFTPIMRQSIHSNQAIMILSLILHLVLKVNATPYPSIAVVVGTHWRGGSLEMVTIIVLSSRVVPKCGVAIRHGPQDHRGHSNVDPRAVRDRHQISQGA